MSGEKGGHSMQTVSITIDGRTVTTRQDSTILEAALSAGINIPTLCHMENQSVKANCRICLVEVEGARTLQPACATKVNQDMQVVTNSPGIMEARRASLELILSHHAIDCQSCVRLGNSYHEDLREELCSYCFYCDCPRDGDCELQQLAKEYDVIGLAYPWYQREPEIDRSPASFEKNPSKCILCRRCVSACGEIQGVYAWSVVGRGHESNVTPVGGVPLAKSPCVECGQCVRSCPTGALIEKHDFHDLPDAIANSEKTVVARAEPHFLRKYLALAGLNPEQYSIANLRAGLKRLGIQIMSGNDKAEHEAVAALEQEQSRRQGNLPLISISCPSALRFMKTHYPALMRLLSETPSPQGMFGWQARDIYGDRTYALSLTACSAKKMEAAEDCYISQVMSPRELHRLFSRSGVDLTRLDPVEVTEPDTQIMVPPKVNAIEEKECAFAGKQMKAVRANGLKAVAEILEQVAAGSCGAQYIQLQACPEGCTSVSLSFFDKL